jgi:hypothetical protein
MVWSYKTRVGTFQIVERDGRFHAMLDDDDLGSYSYPWQAADDLAGGHTLSPSCGVDTATLGISDALGDWETSGG